MKRLSFENELLQSLFGKMFGQLLVQHLPPTEKLSPLPSWEKQNGRSSRSDETAASTQSINAHCHFLYPPPPPHPIFFCGFNGQLAESFPALVTIKSQTFSDGNTIWNALGWSSAPWTREIFDFENLLAPAALPDWKIPCDGGDRRVSWSENFCAGLCWSGLPEERVRERCHFSTCSLITPVPVRRFDRSLFPMRWMFISPPRGRLLCDFKILWLFLKNNYNKQKHLISFILTH